MSESEIYDSFLRRQDKFEYISKIEDIYFLKKLSTTDLCQYLAKNYMLGVVSAKFIPEKSTPISATVVNEGYFNANRGTMGMSKGFSAGGTGLSGHTSQQYGSTGPIVRDEDNAVTIELRLRVELYDDSTEVTPLHRHGDMVHTAPAPDNH